MLESLLYPKSIAVIGASRETSKVGHAFIANLLKSRFEGKVIPVNPKADEILSQQEIVSGLRHDDETVETSR